MAELKKIFETAVETLFSTFEEAVKTGTYAITTDNGFDSVTSTSDDIRCIFEQFTEKDVKSASFSGLIQPLDVKGLIPYNDLILNKDLMGTQGTCLFNSEVYEVVAFELDPMCIIYTVLLRKN